MASAEAGERGRGKRLRGEAQCAAETRYGIDKMGIVVAKTPVCVSR